MHICYVVQVNFDAFDGVITFVNVSRIHWKVKQFTFKYTDLYA